MSERLHRYPFITLPAFSGGSDIGFTLITDQTTQSDLAGDKVVFGRDNAPFSYAVYLERQDAMTENDIDHYIRSKDPDLHKRLLQRKSRNVSHGRVLSTSSNSVSTAVNQALTIEDQYSQSELFKPRTQTITPPLAVEQILIGFKELMLSALASPSRGRSFSTRADKCYRRTSLGIAQSISRLP